MSCFLNPLPWCTIIRLSKLAVKIDVSAVNSVSLAPEVGFEPTAKCDTRLVARPSTGYCGGGNLLALSEEYSVLDSDWVIIVPILL